MFVHNVPLFPVRHRRIGTFLAPDPLHGGRETEWNIETYRMQARGVKIVRARTAPGDAGRPAAGDRLAIKSELDGEPRMLPDAIAALWKTGEVPAPALPEILRTFGPGLAHPRDFEPILNRTGGSRWPKVAAVVFALMLALGAAGAALYAAKRRFPPAPRTEFIQQPTAAWLATPMRPGVWVSTDGPISALSRTELPPDYRPPADRFDNVATRPGYTLARVQAAREQRLVLVSDYERTLLPRCYPSGVAVPTADLALPPAVLAQASLGARALNANLVLGNHLAPKTPTRPMDALAHLWILPVVLAIILSPALLVATILWRRIAARRQQVRDLRRRLGLPAKDEG